jgi:hypothetical protein
VYDEWSRKLPDGRIIRYTSNVEYGRPGMITAAIDGQTKTMEIEGTPTREEVEEQFEMVGLG